MGGAYYVVQIAHNKAVSGPCIVWGNEVQATVLILTLRAQITNELEEINTESTQGTNTMGYIIVYTEITLRAPTRRDTISAPGPGPDQERAKAAGQWGSCFAVLCWWRH